MNKQLEFTLPNPNKIKVDGIYDSHGIKFIGEAVQQFDNTYRCLANIHGFLFLVEVKIIYAPKEK